MYGFILLAKSNVIDFYVDNEEDFQSWITVMKNFVILLDWKEELKLGPLLGEGHFAQVNLCHRKNDPNTAFALKTIKKSKIKETKRNIVSVT